jgi:hypothetical protein
MVERFADWVQQLNDARVLWASGLVVSVNWLIGDMSPLAALATIAAGVLSLAKAYEVWARRRDVAVFKRAVEWAEATGNDDLRAEALEVYRRTSRTAPGDLP